MWQTIIVVVIIGLCVIFGGLRLYRTLKYGGCSCSPGKSGNNNGAQAGREEGREDGQGCNCCAGCKKHSKH